MGCVFNRGKRHQPRWYVKYRDVDGRWKMVPSHQPTKDQARQYVEQVEGRIAAGKIGIPEPTPDEVKRERITVQELADTFLRDYSSPRLKDVEKYRRDVRSILRNLTGPLGYMRVVDMGRAHLSRLRDEKLAAGLSKATVKLILAYTSRMFTWARTEGLIDVQNPVALVDKPSVAGQAMDFNFLSTDEADRLLSWAREKQPKEYPAYASALYTGLRMGELWGLRWADCDLDRGLLTVRRSYRLAPSRASRGQCPSTRRCCPSFASGGTIVRPRMKPGLPHGPRVHEAEGSRLRLQGRADRR
jgi:integrase